MRKSAPANTTIANIGRAAIVAFLIAGNLSATVPAAPAPSDDEAWSGSRIMAENRRRHHQFPFVYEEQTMIMVDPTGNREVRRCRRFSRIEKDRTFKFLLVFDDPEEIRGTALLAVRDPSGETRHGVYLPAFGPEFKHPQGSGLGGHFLGTDFSIEDLAPEPPEEFRYVRQRDRLVDETEYFVVDAYPKAAVTRAGELGLRKHVIRKDSFMIVQTDVYDATLRIYKRITHHDLKRVDADSCRANMVVANDKRDSHSTLLKIDRRVYSRDYVPAEIFDESYLLANRHVVSAAVGVDPVAESTAERQLVRRADDQ